MFEQENDNQIWIWERLLQLKCGEALGRTPECDNDTVEEASIKYGKWKQREAG